MVVIPIFRPEERLARSAEVLTTLLSKTKSPKPVKPRPSGKLKDTKKKVRNVQDVDEDEDEYAFIVKSASQPGKIEVLIGDILVEMVVDSGASTNVIDKHL